jgi:RNA polymerase sigma-B factor
MSLPEEATFEANQNSRFRHITPDIDPLDMGMEVVQRLREAGLSAYFPIEVEQASRGAEVVAIDKFRAPSIVDEEALTIPATLDPLRKRLAEERRARNEDLETHVSTSSAQQPPPTNEIAYRLRPGESLDMLFELSQNGDPTAREKLAKYYMPQARSIARKYSGGLEPLDELEAVANLGLVKALDRFDNSRGFPFMAFAVPTIAGEIKKHFRSFGWGTHVYRGLQEKALELGRVMNQFEENGKECTVEQAAKILDWSYEDTLEAWLVRRGGYQVQYLDSPLNSDDHGDKELTLGDGVSDGSSEDTMIDHLSLVEGIEQMLKNVKPRDREAFFRHILLDQTQAEIAEAIGVSQMQVSRILAKIRAKAWGSISLRQELLVTDSD